MKILSAVTTLLVILAVSVTVSAQDTLFSDDFEWGDMDGFCYAEPPSRGAFEAR